MSAAALPLHRAGSRLWNAALAAWAAVTGLAPHVLHHVGPLAGAALFAGAGGTVLFAAIGFAAAIPFLLRLKRRFATWRAPVIALAVMAAVFSISTLVVGPALTGAGDAQPVQQDTGHEDHHP